MSTRDAADRMRAALADLRGELQLPESFPPTALAEADAAIAAHRMPATDLTDVAFATIDPEGATDLDQAFAIERDGGGWHVHYAIADLPSFVAPGGALDTEARMRGLTLYAADGRIPLHPPVISERAASLLPGEDRAAFVWDLALDAAGAVTGASVGRARVRSRRQWSYEEAHASPAEMALLREVGEARLAQESARGGASLAIPEILVVPDGDGFALRRRVVRPVESWNAQLSLLTGMVAARLMLDGGIGILRTMPPADPEAVADFRRRTAVLGTPWRDDEHYGDFLRRLDPDDPRHLAIRHAAASLFRGAAYRAFDGEPPEETVQAAIGAPYAHVTAPLRRLVDRFGLEVCAALSAGTPVPDGVRAALPDLPSLMGRAASTSGRLDRRTVDIVEAGVLAPHVGETFTGIAVTESAVQLDDPAVETAVDGPVTPGEVVRLRLESVDIPAGEVRFAVSGS